MARIITSAHEPEQHTTFEDLKLAKVERIDEFLNLEFRSHASHIEAMLTSEELQILEAALRVLTLHPKIRKVTT